MVFDAVRKATHHIKFECEKCEHSFSSLNTLSMKDPKSKSLETYRVCDSCKKQIISDIEDHFWYDVISRTDFERIISYLKSVDKIECVYHDNYTAGDITVHTKYATSGVVSDACEHFGYKIHGFEVLTEGDKENYDCFDKHGKCLMIFLVPDGNVEPIPESITKKSYSALDYINESDKIFD